MNPCDDPERQAELVRRLALPTDGAEEVRLIETHVSWVILAGERAYKLKKPVNFGFLDYSTLARRQFFCEEELRLNRRLAPDLYLAVVPVTGTPEAPRLGGEGPALEYAVAMRRFREDDLLVRRAQAGLLTAPPIDALAEVIAGFHGGLAAGACSHEFGHPEQAYAPMAENFAQLATFAAGTGLAERSGPLADWAAARYRELSPLLARRRAEGFIRECHGDLHLGNVVLWQGRPLPFDGIEFNPNLRFVDVMSEVAFLTMDLHDHACAPLAWRFLNRYLEFTGDYAGLALLPWYQAYRAMVRAKIAAIRYADAPTARREAELAECRGYVELADRLRRPRAPRLLLTCGVSGSGKTRYAQAELERSGAVRVRSDVERKRLFGLPPLAPSSGAIYTADATRRTYDRLYALARQLLTDGYPVIVDATFSRRSERERFRALAAEAGVGFQLVETVATPELLRARVVARRAAGDDASEADLRVLEAQLAGFEPIGADEQEGWLRVDTSRT
jgi:aminoglycoside phosphotransferase family enzyme/predicted kinase